METLIKEMKKDAEKWEGEGDKKEDINSDEH
jgi:hypothetical protein